MVIPGHEPEVEDVAIRIAGCEAARGCGEVGRVNPILS
jgi:hypothetical protein